MFHCVPSKRAIPLSCWVGGNCRPQWNVCVRGEWVEKPRETQERDDPGAGIREEKEEGNELKLTSSSPDPFPLTEPSFWSLNLDNCRNAVSSASSGVVGSTRLLNTFSHTVKRLGEIRIEFLRSAAVRFVSAQIFEE